MGWILGDTITKLFVTINSTGALTSADTLPTYCVYANDVPLGGVVSSMLSDGIYVASIDATPANGFEIGVSYNVIVSAVVDSISKAECILTFVLDEKRLEDMNDIAIEQILSDSTPFDGTNINATISSRSSHSDPTDSINAITSNSFSVDGLPIFNDSVVDSKVYSRLPSSNSAIK